MAMASPMWPYQQQFTIAVRVQPTFFTGGPSGITVTTTTGANQTITGNGTEAFSSPLAAADINDDGYTDLLAGAVSASSSLGMTYLFFGGAGGIPNATSTAAPVKFQG
jgi:hypothetical protein